MLARNAARTVPRERGGVHRSSKKGPGTHPESGPDRCSDAYIVHCEHCPEQHYIYMKYIQIRNVTRSVTCLTSGPGTELGRRRRRIRSAVSTSASTIAVLPVRISVHALRDRPAGTPLHHSRWVPLVTCASSARWLLRYVVCAGCGSRVTRSSNRGAPCYMVGVCFPGQSLVSIFHTVLSLCLVGSWLDEEVLVSGGLVATALLWLACSGVTMFIDPYRELPY